MSIPGVLEAVIPHPSGETVALYLLATLGVTVPPVGRVLALVGGAL